MVCRGDLTIRVSDWSRDRGCPLVVANGFLAREVLASGDSSHVVPIFAGMGLAAGVGAGIAVSSGRRVVVLEGDGNHLMGLAAAATVGLLGVPLTHVVHWNGGWESTGGHRLLPEGEVRDVGTGLSYASSRIVGRPEDLSAALDEAHRHSGPSLIHVVGRMGDPVAHRPDITMPDAAVRFMSWLDRTADPVGSGEA